MDQPPPFTSRRTLLAGGTGALLALAGCSALPVSDDTESPSETESPLTRIVVRSDTGESEPLRLTLVYSPPEGHTERPVWTTVDAPADGEPRTAIRDLETGAGVYSLTVVSKRHASHEVVSFNSLADGGADGHQFEAVVKRNGDVWTNLNKAGRSISIPGYDA